VMDAYLASVMTLFGFAVSGYAIQATLKMRAEEAAGRAEPVLATAVGRIGWAACHLLFGLLGPAVVLAAAGLTTGLAHGGSTGLVPAALAQLSAVWIVAALAVALTGLLPRLTSGAWGILGVFLLLSLVGTALQWNTAVLGISPFAHLARMPGEPFSIGSFAWLVLIAAGITAVGVTALRRRDMPIG